MSPRDPTSAGPAARPRILVVDDEAVVRETLSALLRSLDCAPAQAPDAQSAWECLQGSETPDLVLLDVNMPRRDGLSLLRRIHAHLPRLPVVVMSGDSQHEGAALRGGARAFLAKPIELATLRACVARALDAEAATAATATRPRATSGAPRRPVRHARGGAE